MPRPPVSCFTLFCPGYVAASAAGLQSIPWLPNLPCIYRRALPRPQLSAALGAELGALCHAGQDVLSASPGPRVFPPLVQDTGRSPRPTADQDPPPPGPGCLEARRAPSRSGAKSGPVAPSPPGDFGPMRGRLPRQAGHVTRAGAAAAHLGRG